MQELRKTAEPLVSRGGSSNVNSTTSSGNRGEEEQRPQKQRSTSIHQQGSAGSSSVTTSMTAEEKARSMVDQLSMEERESILYEVHGIKDSIPETPELIETSLSQFRELVQQQANENASKRAAAYHQALSISKDYVQNQSLLVSFLRAERFDVPRAVSRYFGFFEWKLELFGLDKLCKDISLQDDFSADDMQVMQNGALSVLPNRDRADRMVVCHILSHQRYKDRMSVMRSVYYIMMSARDVTTQKNGIVAVVYNVDNPKEVDEKLVASVPKMLEVLPIRVVSVHRCFSDEKFVSTIEMTNMQLEKRFRTRARGHLGNHLECQQQLASFGIPLHSLPMSVHGEFSPTYHLEWLQMHHAREANVLKNSKSKGQIDEEKASTHHNALVDTVSPATEDGIILPSRKDVLFGRGRPMREHPGNLRLHFFVEERMQQYEAANKKEKTIIASDVVTTMKAEGIRFLKKENDFWVEVDDEVAREKCSHAFRTRRINERKSASGKQGNSSATSTTTFPNPAFSLAPLAPSASTAAAPRETDTNSPSLAFAALGEDDDSLFGDDGNFIGV